MGDDGFESALQFDVVDQATKQCNELLWALEDNIATENCSDRCTVKDCNLSHTSSHHQIQSIFHCITLSLHCCITSVIHSIQILCDAHNRDCFVQSKYCIKVVLQNFGQIAQSSASAIAVLSSTSIAQSSASGIARLTYLLWCIPHTSRVTLQGAMLQPLQRLLENNFILEIF